MRIARPILLVTTPIGVAWATLEAWRFHWWLAVLMAVMIGIIGGFTWMTVRKVRSEAEAGSGEDREQARSHKPGA